jgi:N-acetylmuramic acid 6-phosphate etherase
MISTGVMVRLGRTYGNLMVGVQATNAKLVARARDIIGSVTGKSEGIDDALEAAGGNAALACLMMARGLDREEASRLLASAGSLRRALVRTSGR